MSFEGGPRPPRPAGRRWMVRLFETSDKLEEHMNRGNLRPDQVQSIGIDADGFFVLVYHVGGEPPDLERRPPPRADQFERRPPPRAEQFERRPPPRSEQFERRPPPAPWRRREEGFGEDDLFDDGPDDRRPPPRRPFDRDSGPRRDLPPRRPPPRR